MYRCTTVTDNTTEMQIFYSNVAQLLFYYTQNNHQTYIKKYQQKKCRILWKVT